MSSLSNRCTRNIVLQSAVVAVVLLTAGCSQRQVGYGKSGPNTAVLKQTLSKLDLQNPASDAKARIAAGDRRPVGIYGYACSVPGPLNHRVTLSTEIRCLDGTSDVAESEEHHHLIEQATAYAEAYDDELHRDGVF
ncbi:hypothetical protein [Dyella mobilis]|uniref:Osmotically inducible lipoprotein OsmE n=1 Tax=Dyella mobilis TaxID=1849582 RepID=A0ABS2KD00_9GAMM|nr:hypothetical protein [Dyella mobilis]MBM7128915.1 hypothetical protein [Dyella mobilis]